MSFRVIGTGSSLPKRVVTNDDLSQFLDTSDEWIYSRTGIKQRHVCTTEGLDDLAIEASRKAVEAAGIDGSEIDLVVGSTTSPDHVVPAIACVAADAIGAKHCAAFDLFIGCSGFVQGLDVVDGFFVRGRAKKALVVAAEKVTSLVDWSDRATCVLFGDGAGAVVLEATDEDPLPMHAWATLDFALTLPGVRSTSPYDQRIGAYGKALTMNGREVFRFAVRAIIEEVNSLVAEAGIDVSDIDHFVFHQANERILASAIKHLGLDDAKVVRRLEDTGNISSACIPLALDTLNRNGGLKRGELICMIGFGAGLSVGSCLTRWEP
mgnify:FL=1